MITRENLQGVINSLSDKDKNRIKNTNKEYLVIELHIFNTGSYATVKLTNNYSRYQNVSNYGNCILETQYVLNLINQTLI